MNYSELIEKAKFLFYWESPQSDVSLEVVELRDDYIGLKSRGFLSEDVKPPVVKISLKVGMKWEDVTLSNCFWSVDAQGSIVGLKVVQSPNDQSEFKKKLGLALCV